VVAFWDHLFEASELGIGRWLRRRQKKPPSHPIRRRNYFPTGESLEQRQLLTTVFFATGSSLFVFEGAGNEVLQVNLNAASANTITVDYATSNGTATAGSDYTSTSGTLTFAPNETSKTISVPIINDTADEDDETFSATLSNPTNATLGFPSNVTVTIFDNDNPPTVQFASSGYSVLETGGSITIEAVLSTASGKTITVNYATSNGSATSGSGWTSSTRRS